MKSLLEKIKFIELPKLKKKIPLYRIAVSGAFAPICRTPRPP